MWTRLATRTIVSAARAVPPMHTARVQVRALSVSGRALATEDSRPDFDRALPPGFEKVAESPSALGAIKELADVLEKNGLDMSGGVKPSMTQMVKLAANADVREKTAKGRWCDTNVSG